MAGALAACCCGFRKCENKALQTSLTATRLYWITYNQISDNMVSQAKTMALHGVPNDLLQNLDPLAIIILIPCKSSSTVIRSCSILTRYSPRSLSLPDAAQDGHPLHSHQEGTSRNLRTNVRYRLTLQIFAGFMLGTSAMVWAAVLQHYIYTTSPCKEYASVKCKSPINVWAQTGVYVLVAASEIMASVTSLEYAFTKAPRNMRSLVQAFSLFMTALAAAIGQAFVPLSDNPKLVWNYVVTALVAFCAGCLFWFTYRDVDKMEDKLNMLPAGVRITTPVLDADLEPASQYPELVRKA